MALKKSQLIDLFMKSQKKTTCNYQKAINSLAEEIRELIKILNKWNLILQCFIEAGFVS